jgi:hypothetical protein
LEKEFEGAHTGNSAGAGLLMQSKVKQSKNASSRWEVGKLKKQ